MNKIFMTKKNTHGQTVVCSEKTRTRGKMSALVLAIAAASAGVVGVAHAELVNTSTAFQATQETGETASGYNATTGNSKSTATGFGTSAISQGSIAIGAEAGASGNGLTREESEGLINAKVTVGSIEEELARTVAPTMQEMSSLNAKEGMFYVDRTVFKTSQDYVEHHQKIMKAVTGIKKINEFIVPILTIAEDDRDLLNNSDGQKIVNSFDELKNIVTDNQELFAKSDKTSFLMDKVQILSNAFEKYKDLDVGEKFNRMTTEEFDALKALYTRDDYRFPNFIVTDFETDKGILFKGNEAADKFSFLSENTENNLKEIINQYNPSEDNANGDKLADTLTTLQTVRQQEVDRLKQISTFLSDELKDALTREPDWFKVTAAYGSESFVEKNNSGKSDYMNDVPYQYRLGLIKTLEALEAAGINAEPEDVIRSYFAFANTKDTRYSSISTETSPKLSEHIINDFEAKTREYLAQKTEYDTKVAALNAEKEKAIEGFKEVAKKLGYPDPSFDDITTILGSLSPNAISVGYRSYVSGESAVGIGAHGLVVGDKAVSVGANNFVAAHKATALGSDISIGASAPEGSVVIGHTSQVAVAEPSENITIASVKYDFAGTAPQSAVSVGSVGKERQIKNVAAGVISATSTDAINGSQLYALAEAVNNLDIPNESRITGTPDITVNTTTKDGVTTHIIGLSDPIKAQIAKEESVSAGSNIVVTQDKLNATGGKNFEVSLKGDLTNINSITNNGKPISFGGSRLTNVAAPIEGSDAANKQYVDDAIKAAQVEPITVSAADDGVTVTKNGNDYAVGLSDKTKATLADVENLKPQVASNTADIEKLKPQVAKNTADIAANRADIENLKPRVAKNEADIAQNTADIEANRANIAKGLNFKTQDGVTTNKQLGDTVTVLGDSNIKTSTIGGNIVVGLNQDTKLNSIKLGDTITATPQGINMGGQGITNLKPGVVAAGSTDAINGDQLFNMGNDIKNHIGAIEDGLEAGLAGSRAVAALPQTHTSGKSMLAVAMGSYRDKGAVAVGFSRLSDNGRTTLKLNLDATTEKTFGAGVGIGYEF